MSKRTNWNQDNAWSIGVNIGAGVLNDIAFEYAPDGTGSTKTHTTWPRSSITLNQWTHLAVVFNTSDSQDARLYVNSVEISPTFVGNTDQALHPSSSDIFFGAVNNGAGARMTGKIDDAWIYDRALTHDEILGLYLLADRDGDGCIAVSEIIDYVNRWKNDQGPDMDDLVLAINLWKAGCN